MTFGSTNVFENSPKPYLNKRYTGPKNRANTYSILGAANSDGTAAHYIDMCKNIVKRIILSSPDKKVVHGCGTFGGIMKAAYEAAADTSIRNIKTKKPLQNLGILSYPLWGDEDKKNCTIIGKMPSEATRAETFPLVSNTLIVFPGGVTTTEEAVTFIRKNNHTKKGQPLKDIVLVGDKKTWKHLTEHISYLNEQGELHYKPEQLFRIAHTEDEILKNLKLQKLKLKKLNIRG
jgi:predicted Rossmann-fold nucleotide-binding protein